jgi:G3E family GTPase
MTPLYILVGFLGAGKTTLLRRLVPELIKGGALPSIILNDYANARIDASLFVDLQAAVRPINGSCVCCGSRDELIDALEDYKPTKRGIVLLESNGTTDSEELISLLAMEPRLRGFDLPAQISVIDAKRWQKRFWHNTLEREQVRTASFWILAHADEVPLERLETVRRSVRELCGLRNDPSSFEEIARELISAAHRATPGALRAPAFGPNSHRPLPGEDTEHPVHYHNPALHHFSALEFALPALITRKELVGWLANLPDNVLRVKGLVRFAEEPDAVYLFQKAAVSDTPQLARLPAADTYPESVAVLVGHDLHPHLALFL